MHSPHLPILPADFVNNARTLQEKQKFIEEFNTIVNNDTILESLGKPNYEIIISNTTEYDLSGTELKLNFLDNEGVVVNISSSYLNSWASGETGTANVYIDSDFDKCQLALSTYYGDYGEQIITEYKDIDIIDNMTINLETITKSPIEISEIYYDGEIYSTCRITDYSYDNIYWNNGKASFDLKFSGEKTFDSSDSSTSTYCVVGWKIYDSNNVVVASGEAYTDAVSVGQSFKNCTGYVSDLEPGTYKLEIINVQY